METTQIGSHGPGGERYPGSRAQWNGKMEQAEVNAMVARGAAAGVNIVDCWMSDPAVRSALGEALEPSARCSGCIQGHIGSTWQDGQYVRTRELDQVRPAFEDLLERLRTDHVELGMIHCVDACDEFRAIMDGPSIEYVRELLAAGKIGTTYGPSTPQSRKWRCSPAASRRSRSSCSR